MKRIKEFVKKIGNKKYCLLSLLLAGLLIFAVLRGLNGSKSAKTEANALSSPATKNLDLNGIRYSYQTSLKELKNNYGMLKYYYNENLFTISESSEGEVFYSAGGQTDGGEENSTQQAEAIISLANDYISFFDINNKIIDNNLTYDNSVGSNNSNSVVGVYGNDFDLGKIKKIEIDFENLFKEYPLLNREYFKIGYNEDNTSGVVCSFVFVKNGISPREDKEYYKNNSIFLNYATDINPKKLTLNISEYNGFQLRQIYCNFASEATTKNTEIRISVPNIYIERNSYNDYEEIYAAIDNVKFIQDNVNNIISFNSYFNYNVDETIYKGNILLSNDKYDENFIDNLYRQGNNNGIINLQGKIYFGGVSNPNDIVQSELIFNRKGSGNSSYSFFVSNQLNNINYAKSPVTGNIFNISYKKQSRLLYIEDINTLRGNINGTQFSALSSQVEDVLYGVEYVGNIEQDEFNKKVEDDLLDLLKLGGFGAIIGLIIGLIAGVPGIGAGVGALIGAAIAVIPLIIDALQAIFGYQFLSGLYNFINSITEFFVKIVDTIINFLFSIITNPFVLILIAIVVIVYIFVIRKDE